MGEDGAICDTVASALDDWPHCWAVEAITSHADRAVLGVRVEYLHQPIRFAELETRCGEHGVIARVTALESVDDPELPRLRVDARRRPIHPRTLAGP
jgi:DNA-binding LytR/AlgR family response regulator